MTDEANEHVLVPGPDGGLYLVPSVELAAYRLSDEEAAELVGEIEAKDPEVSGFGQVTMLPTSGSIGGRPRPPAGGAGGYTYQSVVATTRGGVRTIQVPIAGLGIV